MLSNENILKDTKVELLEKKRKEAELSGNVIKNSWWGGVTLEGSYNFTDIRGESDNYPSFTASISQDIFRSGGIYWQIKKGKLYKSLNFATLDLEEQTLLFTLYELVININKLDIEIEKQKLLIENQRILIKNLKDSYLNGVADISQLDESIIELNSLKNGEEGIVQSRIDLMTSLKDLTDLNYNEIDVPNFSLISRDEFISKNSNIDIQKKSVEATRLDKNLAYSQYLPRVSLYGSYSYEDTHQALRGKESSMYGAKLTIPLGFNMGDAFEAAQVTYLRSQAQLKDLQENQKSIYERVVTKLQSIDRRIANTKELIESYQNIYSVTESYYKSNLKTEDDVTLLKNRVEISKLDLNIFELDKKGVVLALYKLLKK
jgi:outer membrane protein TolC